MTKLCVPAESIRKKATSTGAVTSVRSTTWMSPADECPSVAGFSSPTNAYRREAPSWNHQTLCTDPPTVLTFPSGSGSEGDPPYGAPIPQIVSPSCHSAVNSSPSRTNTSCTNGLPIGRTSTSCGVVGSVRSTTTSCAGLGFTARNAYSRPSTRPSFTVCTPFCVLGTWKRESCRGRAGSLRSNTTIEPGASSVATTSSVPSSEIWTSPVVVAPSMISESTSTGASPDTSQIFTALPTTPPRLPHVVVYAQPSRAATSAV